MGMNDHAQGKFLFEGLTRSWPRAEADQAGRVAIITRTKDRPLLLRRACESVLAQSYQNWLMIIINDGGLACDVEEVLAPYMPMFGPKLRVVHNPVSLGMEAASNIGLRANTSEFVVILDDDDTWHPDFLRETTAALTDAGNVWMGGIVCHVRYVHERIENGVVHFEGEGDYYSGLSTISLDRLLAENFIATGSFLYRRAVLNEIGGYDESLPVMGDWEFLIRFLLVADIGVVAKPLAYYHYRTNLQDTPYQNSVRQKSFPKWDVLIRNAAMREAFKLNPQLVGVTLNLNKNLLAMSRDIAKTNGLDDAFEELKNNVYHQNETIKVSIWHHEERVRKYVEELFQKGLAMQEERLAAGMQARMTAINEKTDEVHLWLGILTWPLRVVWRPVRRLVLRIASEGR